jgi:parvulin-like peptidyl-prolyl isomerase
MIFVSRRAPRLRRFGVAMFAGLGCCCITLAGKPGVVGRVGGQEVSAEEVRAALATLPPAEQARLPEDPALLQQMVHSILVRKAVLQELLEKKWDQSPEMKARMEQVREAALTESYLQTVSQAPESYPDETELQSAYQSAKPTLLVPRSYRLAQIFIAEPKNGTEAELKEARAKADAAYAGLLAPGGDFGVIAKSESEEKESAANGGEIGWLAENQIQPEIRAQLPKLSLNIVSRPIKLNDGWHILKVLDAREPYTPTLEQVRGRLREQMRAEKARANGQAFVEKLLQARPVTVDEAALAKALLPDRGH